MKKHLYEIKKLEIPAYLKWWFIQKKFSGTLSEILENLTSPITLTDSLKRRFKIFKIGGNSVQDGEPSPETQVPIQNVTGNVEVKVENKNKLKGLSTPKTDSDYWQIVYSGNNFTPLEDGWGKFEYNNANGSTTVFINAKTKLNAVSLKPNTQYTIVTEIRNANFSGSGAYFQVFTNNADSVFTTNKNYSTNGIFKVLATTKESFEGIINSLDSYLRIGAGTSATAEVRLSVFEGDVDITNFTYIEHEEQTAIFPLEEGQILHEGDTIEDKIVQRRGTIDLSSLTWNKATTTDSQGNTFGFYATLTERPKQNETQKNFALCNILRQQKRSEVTIIDTEGFYLGKYDALYIKIKQSLIPNGTVAELNTLLTDTNATLEYELATPIEIPFTEAQRTAKAQIDSLQTYKGITHISSTNDPSPLFTIQYVKEET